MKPMYVFSGKSPVSLAATRCASVWGASVLSLLLGAVEPGLALAADAGKQPKVVASSDRSGQGTPNGRDIQLDAQAANRGTATQYGHAIAATTAAGWLASLGVAMLTDDKDPSTQGQQPRNQVVSPVSLASALGLVHAGATGATADELSNLLAPATARRTAYQHDLPLLLKDILADQDTITSANRLWVDASLAKSLSAPYLQTVKRQYGADGAFVSFAAGGGQDATRSINAWAAEKTDNRIKKLLPDGALNASSRVVLTNGVHLRAAWVQAFDASETKPKPFIGASKPVPP